MSRTDGRWWAWGVWMREHDYHAQTGNIELAARWRRWARQRLQRGSSPGELWALWA